MFFLFCRSLVHFRKNFSIRHTDQTITGHVRYKTTEIFMWSMHQEIQNNWRLAKTSTERTWLGFYGGSHKQFIQKGSHCTIPGLVHEMFSAFAGHKWWRIQDGWRRENSKKFQSSKCFYPAMVTMVSINSGCFGLWHTAFPYWHQEWCMNTFGIALQTFTVI